MAAALKRMAHLGRRQGTSAKGPGRRARVSIKCRRHDRRISTRKQHRGAAARAGAIAVRLLRDGSRWLRQLIAFAHAVPARAFSGFKNSAFTRLHGARLPSTPSAAASPSTGTQANNLSHETPRARGYLAASRSGRAVLVPASVRAQQQARAITSVALDATLPGFVLLVTTPFTSSVRRVAPKRAL